MLSVEDEHRYKTVITSTFGLTDEMGFEDLSYQGIKQWDSLGHMALMAALEDEFSIELEIDDIIDFSSVKIGRGILARYALK
jgi:acyl carrier protein